jgi:hypothetical protein
MDIPETMATKQTHTAQTHTHTHQNTHIKKDEPNIALYGNRNGKHNTKT